MFNTVSINYEGYTKKEVEATILAPKVQARVDHLSYSEFKHIMRDKLLENYPVKLEHMTNKNNIFGPNVSGLRRNSVRTNPVRVEREYIPTSRFFSPSP